MRRSGIAALLLAAVFVLPNSARAQTADDCYQATLKEDDNAIIRICSQALDKGNMSTEDRSITLSNRGLGYLRNKEYDKSIIDFSDALLINPKNAYSFNFRGDAWLQKSNYDRALADFDEALRIDPQFTGAFYNRGQAFERQGNVNAARTEYRKAVATTNTRALDNWARDRSRERLTALGDNQQQQNQTQNRPQRQDNNSSDQEVQRESRRNSDNQRTPTTRNDNEPGREGIFRRTR